MAIQTLEDVVRDYIQRFRDRANREGRWFATQKSLDQAIEKAAMAVSPAGKRLNHQRRIPRSVLRVWADALLERRNEIRASKTFAKLHAKLEALGAELDGIGELTVYDTAVRIGAFLKLEPDRVYLHAGARDGARALGFNGRNSLSPAELPRPLRRLKAGEIEDALCIYANFLGGAIKRSERSGPRGCFGESGRGRRVPRRPGGCD